ncbi:MAG: hypothetical protein SWC96_05640 [Thermodesulfobacteriota bacterium]|nr:hypothetical protein [Thermodesulfobacteriota bacterium]
MVHDSEKLAGKLYVGDLGDGPVVFLDGAASGDIPSFQVPVSSC